MTKANSRSLARNDDRKLVDVTITYLEQETRPNLPEPAKPNYKLALLRAENPPIHFYRYLYRVVGDDYHWISRRNLDDDALAEIIQDAAVYIYVLYINGTPAGFSEIDARKGDMVEIRFFGLAPEYVGRGVGRYFLTQIVDLAWGLGPKKVRLETCSLDHPAALPLYQRFGFSVYDRRDVVVELSAD